MDRKILLITVAYPVFKLLLPRFQKLAADYVADNLNEHRQRRHTAKMAALELEAKAEKDLQTLCAEALPELVAPPKRAGWPLVSSATVGIAIGIAAGLILAKREG